MAKTAVVLSIVAYSTSWWFLRSRAFDLDEFEHLHFAWCVSRNLLPYRDFFEHHTPWFHYLLAVGLRFAHVDRSAGALSFIFFARGLDLVFAGAALVLTFALARLITGSRAAWLATTLLAFSGTFAGKTIEIRPDVLATVLWLGCLVALTSALRGGYTVTRNRLLFVLSGALLGGAIMTTQKVLLAMPGFCVTMLWFLFSERGDFAVRLRAALLQFAGFATVIAATLCYFWARGIFVQFVDSNLLMNLHWQYHLSPARLLRILVTANSILVAFGAAGLILDASRQLKWGISSAPPILLLNTVSLIAGIFEMPVVREQYYLLFLPLLAIYSGTFIESVADAIAGIHPLWHSLSSRYALAILFILGSLAMLVLLSPEGAPAWMGVVVALLLAASVELILRSNDLALGVMLVALCILPYRAIYYDFDANRNQVQVQRLTYVLDHTAPTDSTMDGWTGLGVFRPHAYFYWFIHPEILAMLTADQRADLLRGLEAGTIAPAIIFMDPGLQSLSPPITMFFLTYYAPVSGEDPIWMRRR